MDGLKRLNETPEQQARDWFASCCGSTRWVDAMIKKRPFKNEQALYDWAEIAWARADNEDCLEAIAHHPRIGDKAALKAKWAGQEQAGAARASEAVLDELARLNAEYEAKFGHVFIVCATGKSADEMLGLLRTRLGNEPGRELPIAAAEIAKITRLRLEKLLRD